MGDVLPTSAFVCFAGAAIGLALLAGCGRSPPERSPDDTGEGGSGGAGEFCDQTSCDEGCCSEAGACVDGTADEACGTNGACDDCRESSQICETVAHRCVDPCVCGNDLCEAVCREDSESCPRDCPI